MPRSPPSELRRSLRLGTHDSNGRDFLADSIGWTRQELEEWITSPTVQPHLQYWHRICIGNPRRFNDAVDWINSGEQGYFYNPNDLEEDLLLICLGEGDESADYEDEAAKTSAWITQELWARTAWRIVHANQGESQAFEKYIHTHPAACYAFAIDLLCLAFHSLAFRRAASVYMGLIFGVAETGVKPRVQNQASHTLESLEDEDDTQSTATASSNDDEGSEYTDDGKADNNDRAQTPMTSEGGEEAAGEVKSSFVKVAEHVTVVGDGTKLENLYLIDESGVPITGYRRAAG